MQILLVKPTQKGVSFKFYTLLSRWEMVKNFAKALLNEPPSTSAWGEWSAWLLRWGRDHCCTFHTVQLLQWTGRISLWIPVKSMFQEVPLLRREPLFNEYTNNTGVSQPILKQDRKVVHFGNPILVRNYSKEWPFGSCFEESCRPSRGLTTSRFHRNTQKIVQTYSGFAHFDDPSARSKHQFIEKVNIWKRNLVENWPTNQHQKLKIWETQKRFIRDLEVVMITKIIHFDVK